MNSVALLPAVLLDAGTAIDQGHRPLRRKRNRGDYLRSRREQAPSPRAPVLSPLGTSQCQASAPQEAPMKERTTSRALSFASPAQIALPFACAAPKPGRSL